MRDLSAALKAVGVTFADPKDSKQWEQNVQGAIQNIFNAVNGLFSGIGQIEQNALQTSLNNLDIKKKAEEDAATAGITDADTKTFVIAGIEKKYDKEKTDLKREAAKKEKALAIAEAISGVAQAIIAAWKLPPPFNIIAAAAAAAMGAVEIAVIRSQPIPLASGAVFNQPTDILMGGQAYRAGGEGIEVMATESTLRRIVREESGGSSRAGGRSGLKAMQVQIFIGPDKIKDLIVDMTQDAIIQKDLIIRTRDIQAN
jgi:hypothetical protein